MECLPAGSLKNLYRWHFLSICFFLWSLFLYTCCVLKLLHISLSFKTVLKGSWKGSGISVEQVIIFCFSLNKWLGWEGMMKFDLTALQCFFSLLQWHCCQVILYTYLYLVACCTLPPLAFKRPLIHVDMHFASCWICCLKTSLDMSYHVAWLSWVCASL